MHERVLARLKRVRVPALKPPHKAGRLGGGDPQDAISLNPLKGHVMPENVHTVSTPG